MNQSLIAWSERFQHLPWRQHRTLYTTLVSEIMLQQTTVPVVIKKFIPFIEKYPTIPKLAKATEDEIMIAWKGLGYYRRAKNLLKAAQHIVNNLGGEIPLNEKKLLSIPGIGDYTAGAILSIGADLSYLAIDGNLERVLSRYFLLPEQKGPRLKKAIKALLPQIINSLSPRAVNEALMDLGREICLPKNPICTLCPIESGCLAMKNKKVQDYPTSKKKKEIRYHLNLAHFIVWDNDKVLLTQKESNEWLSGQYELPTFTTSCNDPSLSQYPSIQSVPFDLNHHFKSNITKYNIDNSVYIITPKQWQNLAKEIGIDSSRYIYSDLNKYKNITINTLKSLQVKEIAIAILLNRKNEVFLQIRNENGPLQGLYEFPGGKIEKNETPLEAAQREFREEVSLKLSSNICWRALNNYYHHYADRTVHLHAYVAKDHTLPHDSSFHDPRNITVEIPKANQQVMSDLVSWLKS